MSGEGRRRLDIVLVRRGLARTRSHARDLVVRGCVRLGGQPAGKPGQLVAADADITLAQGAVGYVSRGGHKLETALDGFGYDPAGRACLDIGASTGGFTDLLLARGAARVYAVDVGRGQLAASLARDARVVSLEGVDARSITRGLIAEPVTAIVADVSFISLTLVLPAALALAGADAWLVALVKPQFEAGRGAAGKGGIVRDAGVRAAAVDKVRAWLADQPGWAVDGVVASAITGAGGNQEFLIGARASASSRST